MDENEDSSAVSYYRERVRLGRRVNAILRLYIAVGVMLAIVGVGYLVYSKLHLTLDEQEKLALAAALVGGFTSAISAFYLIYRRSIYEQDTERAREHQAVGLFLELWSRFEDTIRERTLGEYAGSRASIRDVMKAARDTGLISIGDQVEADALLQFRNTLVHGVGKASFYDLEDYRKRLVRLLSKLE
jgi:hypothetical protein